MHSNSVLKFQFPPVEGEGTYFPTVFSAINVRALKFLPISCIKKSLLIEFESYWLIRFNIILCIFGCISFSFLLLLIANIPCRVFYWVFSFSYQFVGTSYVSEIVILFQCATDIPLIPTFLLWLCWGYLVSPGVSSLSLLPLCPMLQAQAALRVSAMGSTTSPQGQRVTSATAVAHFAAAAWKCFLSHFRITFNHFTA